MDAMIYTDVLRPLAQPCGRDAPRRDRGLDQVPFGLVQGGGRRLWGLLFLENLLEAALSGLDSTAGDLILQIGLGLGLWVRVDRLRATGLCLNK